MVFVPAAGAEGNVTFPLAVSAVNSVIVSPVARFFTLVTAAIAFSGSTKSVAVPSGENHTRRFGVSLFTACSSVPPPSGGVLTNITGT